MNYLSHYFLDQQSEDPYLILGTVLPDLFRVGDRKRRMPEASPDLFSQPSHKALQTGINKHHLVDRLFHNALFFHKYSKAISKELREVGLEGMPRFQHFYGHILLEILIDKWLLTENPVLVQDFYDLLNRVDLKEVNEFLKLKSLDQHFDSFVQHFNAFLEYRYLEHYLQNGGVVHAMTKIAEKMHKYDLSKSSDQKKMQLVVDQGMALIENDYPKIFDTIKTLCDRDEIS